MQKSIFISVGLIAGAAASLLAWRSHQQLASEVRQLRAERLSLAGELGNAQRTVAENARLVAILEQRLEAQVQSPVPVHAETSAPTFVAPSISLDANGKKAFTSGQTAR
jgi:hypothetical protein